MTGAKPKLISLDDLPTPHTEALGWQWAYGCFETFIWRDGRTVALDRHLARLLRGMEALSLAPPMDAGEMQNRIEKSLHALAEATWRVRLEAVLDDPALMNGEKPPFRSRIGLRVVEADRSTPTRDFRVRALPPEDGETLSPLPSYKPLAYSDRLRARNAALQQGFNEGIVIGNDARLVSGLVSNVFVRSEGGIWRTPPLESGCLPGITRSLVLDFEPPEPVEESPLGLSDLVSAVGMIFANSAIGLQPANQIELAPGETRDLETEQAWAMSQWFERRFWGKTL